MTEVLRCSHRIKSSSKARCKREAKPLLLFCSPCPRLSRMERLLLPVLARLCETCHASMARQEELCRCSLAASVSGLEAQYIHQSMSDADFPVWNTMVEPCNDRNPLHGCTTARARQ